MRSLFLKIFIWFWLAITLVGSALVLSVSITQPEPVVERWRYITGTALAIYVQTAAEIFERDGRRALSDYLERVERTAHIRAFVFDDQGRELSGRSAPAGAKDLAAQARASGEAEFKFTDTYAFAAQRVVGRHGHSYVLVAEMRRPLFGPLRGDPPRRALRLLVVFLTAGVVCYGLARYLTAPIIKLRTATRKLASGDLSARVGPAVGKRHDELADLSRDFDLMAERIESLVTAQRRLLSDISHELRSPLARLSVALGLARQRAGAEASGALDRIEREAERLNDLIGQLLALARLESGVQVAEDAYVDLARLVDEIAADADFEARSRNRSVRVVASQACTMKGTVTLLRSAIENVVRNAVRYTAEGTEVEITLGCSANGDGTRAVIRVRDHGAGVPEAALADLFRPFYRVADARDRQSGGTGLGLAITERAVRLHGGTVTAANAPGGGLLVELRLPA